MPSPISRLTGNTNKPVVRRGREVTVGRQPGRVIKRSSRSSLASPPVEAVPCARNAPRPGDEASPCGDKKRMLPEMPPANERRLKSSRKSTRARAGVAGVHAQGTRRMGLRRSRYIGEPRTHLQHVVIATAINVCRLHDWVVGVAPHSTPLSHAGSLHERGCLMEEAISPPIPMWERAPCT
jgi:hypothetical protein